MSAFKRRDPASTLYIKLSAKVEGPCSSDPSEAEPAISQTKRGGGSVVAHLQLCQPVEPGSQPAGSRQAELGSAAFGTQRSKARKVGRRVWQLRHRSLILEQGVLAADQQGRIQTLRTANTGCTGIRSSTARIPVRRGTNTAAGDQQSRLWLEDDVVDTIAGRGSDLRAAFPRQNLDSLECLGGVTVDVAEARNALAIDKKGHGRASIAALSSNFTQQLTYRACSVR